MIPHRYFKANNPYLKNYDKTKEHQYIIYQDANNLYGWAMIQKLPTGEFEWVDPELFTQESILNMDTDGDYGYFIEVDLEYPEDIHDYHNDLPFLREKRQGEWSPYCQEIANELGMKNTDDTKLIPTLNDKEKYVVHFKHLQLALQHGLKLKKVHQVLKFKQEPVMKDYIMNNTNLRMNAKDDFEKDFFKLMNNSPYGKTMENVRGYSNLNVCTNDKQFFNQTKKPTYKGSTIVSEELGITITNSNKDKIQFCKPIFLGSAILDLSKYLMYDYYYGYVKPKYGDNVKVGMLDTDSFLMGIKTNDVYKDMEQDKDKFDLSNYGKNPNTAFLKDNENKKVLGKFKDETEGIPITEYVGLRSKLYDFEDDEGTNEKRAKGIKKGVIKKQLNHEKFLKSLKAKTAEEMESKVSFKAITSSNHNVYTEQATKSALNPLDSKRFILDDGITTRALGHYKNKK